MSHYAEQLEELIVELAESFIIKFGSEEEIRKSWDKQQEDMPELAVTLSGRQDLLMLLENVLWNSGKIDTFFSQEAIEDQGYRPEFSRH